MELNHKLQNKQLQSDSKQSDSKFERQKLLYKEKHKFPNDLTINTVAAVYLIQDNLTEIW